MIPRYAPTYTYSDLFECLGNVQGENTTASLAARLADLFHVKHIFLTASARVGLCAILRAYNRPGRVLMPAYNCIVVPEAVCYAGYQPRFVDIDLGTLNVSPALLENAITSDTTAVLATHLFGIPCNLKEILPIFSQRDILVIEDAAPALGAEFGGMRVGCFGDASVISFQSTKVISAEVGGALLTNNDELANRLYGFLPPHEVRKDGQVLFLKAMAYKTALNPAIYAALRLGYAALRKEVMYEVVPAALTMPERYLSGMPSYACALVQRQLDRLEWNLGRRRRIAGIYRAKLADHSGWVLPEIAESSSPSWIQFPLICDDKPAFYKHMRAAGVDVSWTYKYSCAESFGIGDCPNTKQAAMKVASLPTTPFLTDDQADRICAEALRFSPHARH